MNEESLVMVTRMWWIKINFYDFDIDESKKWFSNNVFLIIISNFECKLRVWFWYIQWSDWNKLKKCWLLPRLVPQYQVMQQIKKGFGNMGNESVSKGKNMVELYAYPQHKM